MIDRDEKKIWEEGMKRSMNIFQKLVNRVMEEERRFLESIQINKNYSEILYDE